MTVIPRLRATTLLAALALLIAAAPASAAGFTASTTDPVGDSTAGPGSDLSAVDVAYDQVGTAVVNWTLDTTATGPFREVTTFGTLVKGECGGPNQLFVFVDSDGSFVGWRQIANGSDIDGPNSQPRTTGITVTRGATQLTASLNDPGAAGFTYTCAKAESADSPADATVFDAVSTFPAAKAPPTLATLPGSLLAPQKCQKLGGTGFVQTRKPVGVGTVKLQLRSNATSPPGTPLKLSIVGGQIAKVGWKLDGTTVSGTARLLTLRPAQLAKQTAHVIAVTFTAKDGTTTTFPLKFKTLTCSSALTVTQSRKGGGTTLRLRIDSTSATSKATFTVPSAVKAATTSVKVRLRRAGADRTLTYVYRVANGRIYKPKGAPTIKGTGTGLSISGLPAQTGILRVDFTTGAKPVTGTLRATAVIGRKTTRLSTKADGS